MLPSLNHIILTVALQALREGNIHHCETMGFTYDEMNLLGCLSINDLSPSVRHLYRLSILLSAMMSCKNYWHHPRGKQASGTTEQSCQAGGLNRTDEPLFRVGSRETCARRRLLGVSVPNGRTPIPDEETDAAIWHQWQKYRSKTLIPRRRWTP